MLCFGRPTPQVVCDFLEDQKSKALSYSHQLATLQYATKEDFEADTTFNGYDIDHHRISIGRGEEIFRMGVDAIKSWKQFQLDWVDLYYPESPIADVAIAACSLGIWTLSACRIVYVVDEDQQNSRKFGFGYGTLPVHVENGEERFVIEWDKQTNEVFYDILSFSTPQKWFVRMTYPVARYIQQQFAQASLHALHKWIKGQTSPSISDSFV